MTRSKQVRRRSSLFRPEIQPLEDRRQPGDSFCLLALAVGAPGMTMLDRWLNLAIQTEPLVDSAGQVGQG